MYNQGGNQKKIMTDNINVQEKNMVEAMSMVDLFLGFHGCL